MYPDVLLKSILQTPAALTPSGKTPTKADATKDTQGGKGYGGNSIVWITAKRLLFLSTNLVREK